MRKILRRLKRRGKRGEGKQQQDVVFIRYLKNKDKQKTF